MGGGTGPVKPQAGSDVVRVLAAAMAADDIGPQLRAHPKMIPMAGPLVNC